MSDKETMLNEVIDLATLMRPFLGGKPGPVVMTTLCLLIAESLITTGAPGSIDANINVVTKCVRDYHDQIRRFCDDTP